jgi:DNA-binding MarR family transcriptional regulator
MQPDHASWNEPTLGFLLHDVARLLRKRLEQRARAAGIGLTRAQWQALANIARCEGINQAGLAAILDVEPITLGRLLDRMEATGLVERRHDPKDRRQRNLFLTERAWPELERIRALGALAREEALAGLDESARRRLLDTLSGIKANLQASLAGSEAEDEGDRRHG